MVAALIAEGAISVLVVIWFTAMQSLVPNELLGRVSSLDWMITILGAPISFLVVGPLAAAFGADAVLIVAGILGAGSALAFMLMPALAAPSRTGRSRSRGIDPRRQRPQRDRRRHRDPECERQPGGERAAAAGDDRDRGAAEARAQRDAERVHQQRR